jgi:diguanylate cyclase
MKNVIAIIWQLKDVKYHVITFFAALTALIFFLLILSYFLFRNLRMLKKQNKKISNFNDLRKTFFDADRSIIHLKDENLKYLLVNKALEELYQKEEAEIIGKDDFDLIDEEFAIQSKRTDLDALEKKSIVLDKVKWGDRIFQTTKFPVLLTNKKYGVGAYIRDVTEEYNNKIELFKANKELKLSGEKLKLILDSVAEAIFGSDLNGNCTFCNKSCLRLLGYRSEEELIGKNLHMLIHHTRQDGTSIQLEDCKILSTLLSGEEVHNDDEVFWRSDGTYFNVEYFSYPEYKEGELSGAVITFLDITARKEEEKNILYHSYHDTLTGLYNRRYLDEKLEKLDHSNKLPISIIMGDVNGLKQTNDIFGHAAGDVLIQKAAESIKKVCRADDICIRSGGDEFIIILPKTPLQEAEMIAKEIKDSFSKENIKGFSGSISLGCSTKTHHNEDIVGVIDKADEKMYSGKVNDYKGFHENYIEAIMKELYENCPREKEHSERVSELCYQLGRFMNLSESELQRLITAGFYHDIGKIAVNSNILNKKDELTGKEYQMIKRHPVMGYRILNFSDSTLNIAKYVLSHHERWDGEGYPNGLKGEAIPKISRILAIADSYDLMKYGSNYRKSIDSEEIIQELQKNAGTQFDPEIVQKFIAMLQETEA